MKNVVYSPTFTHAFSNRSKYDIFTAASAFGEMFSDFGVILPSLVQILLNISNTLMAYYGVGFALLFCSLIYFIIQTYITRHRSGSRKALFSRLWAIFVFLVVLMGVVTVSMFQPIFVMQEVVDETVTESNKTSEPSSSPAP